MPLPRSGEAGGGPRRAPEEAPRKHIGLRDVARVAGVSPATVSRAMNYPEMVSGPLRARIESVIKHLGWVPHGAARALATRQSGTVGAVFPTLSHGDFARAIHVLQDELTTNGYTLLLACSEYDAEQECKQVRKLLERGVDALVLVGEAHHADLPAIIAGRGVPVVNTFVYNPHSHGTCIGPDNHKALYRLTTYLAELGHRRFGVIAQSTVNNDRALARLQGVRDALADRSIAIHPAHFVEGRWDIREGRELFRRIVAHAPHPTAVICGNAYLAIGAMLEAQTQGIAVPQEMSIVGYDDVEIMGELPIPLTTIRVSAEEVARRAARFLVAQVEGRPQDMPFECEAEIILRASSGPPPAEGGAQR
jgi:LacI family transcriptional regulator, galactose operon repressor